MGPPLDLHDPRITELRDVRGLLGHVEDPLADPRLRGLRLSKGAAQAEDEVEVFGVGLELRHVHSVHPGRMGAERRLHHGGDVLAGQLHQLGVAPDEAGGDDLLHRHDRTAARGHRRVEVLVQRRRRQHVAGAVGRPRVKQREVGRERANQPDPAASAERIVGGDEVAVARVVLLHRGAEQRACRREGHPHGAGEQAQRQRQHRPVLNGDPAVEHRAADERLGHRIRIALADERRHQALDEATDDQRGPGRAEAGTADGPARPAAPPLARQLTHQRIGPAVGRAQIDGLPRCRQAAHRLVERRELVRAVDGWDRETAADDVGVIGVHRYERPRRSRMT